MGIITIEDNGVYYEFEKSENDTKDFLRILTGAKVIMQKTIAKTINPVAEEDISAACVSDDISDVENNTPSESKNEIELYSPNSKEIKEFIISRPQYKHTTKEILAHFNGDIDIENIRISRNDGNDNRAWYGVLQKLRPIRKRIEKSERGEWVKERVGLETEYTFKKY